MDISNDKLNVYKDLAKKCESFELFLWTVGSKEPWMIEAGKAETEATLKSIYNGVHIADKQRLFVDMDGTLAEFKPVDTLEVLYEKDYFLNLKPNENVLGAVRQLIARNDIDVYILSAYLSDSHYALDEKNAWLDKYLPELPQEKRLFVPCGTDKSVVVPGRIKHDDYLLDDYTKNLSEWEPPARGIKLINGINHTNGTWQGDKIQFTHSPEEISNMISSVMKGEAHFYEDKIVTESVTKADVPDNAEGEYDIEITEVLQRVVSTKAESLQEAIHDVEEKYYNSEIVLDADDLKETTIEAVHPQPDKELNELKSSLETIRKTSSGLITGIEDKLEKLRLNKEISVSEQPLENVTDSVTLQQSKEMMSAALGSTDELLSLYKDNNSRTVAQAVNVVAEERAEYNNKLTVKQAIENRQHTHYGAYADIGTALDKFSTDELIDYLRKNEPGGEGSLRGYVESQIIGAQINRERYQSEIIL